LVRVLGIQYRKSSKTKKTRILDQFIAVSGYHRKHAIRLLSGETENIANQSNSCAIRLGRRIYDEAVKDGMVLDLRYEARDIDQYITSQKKIDQWFDVKTSGLSKMAKVQLKQKWGTMQKVLSSQSRLEMIVDDILLDMETRPRLIDRCGNAMLVCSSIYQACKCYELFSNTDLKGKCAIITSYHPSIADIKGEEAGEGMTFINRAVTEHYVS